MEARLTPEQREAIANALYAGQKIEAIKQLREISGLELKKSKDIIDLLEADLRTAHPDRFTKRRSKGFGCVVILILLLTAGVVMWNLFRVL